MAETTEGGGAFAGAMSKLFIPLVKKFSGADKKKSGADKKKTGKETESDDKGMELSKGDKGLQTIVDALEALRDDQDDLFMQSIDYQIGKKKSKRGDQDDKLKGFWGALFKGKFFDTMRMVGIKSMGFLKQMASDSIINFLIGLALLAMFDPSGSFLMSLIDMLLGVFMWLMNTFLALLPKIINLLIVVGPKIAAAIGKAIWALLQFMAKSLWQSIKAIFENPSGTNILGLILKIFLFGAILGKIMGPILGIATKVWSIFSSVFSMVGSIFGVVGKIFNFVGPIFSRIFSLVGTIASKLFGFLFPILSKIFGVILPLLGKALMLIFSPIGLIILGIGLLVGLFILLYKKSEAFRNFVDNVLLPIIYEIWEVMKSVFGWLWDSVLKPMGEALIAVFGFLWNNVLKPIFQGIWFMTKLLFKAWSAVFGWFKKAIMSIIDAGKAVLDWFANFSIKKVFEGIGNIGKVIWDSITSGLSGLRDWFAEIWEWLKGKVGMGKSKEALEVIRGEVQALEKVGLKGVSDELAEDFFAKLQRRNLNADSVKKIQEMAAKDPRSQAALQAIMDKFLKESKEISGYQSEKNLVDTKGIIDQLKVMDSSKASPYKDSESIKKAQGNKKD